MSVILCVLIFINFIPSVSTFAVDANDQTASNDIIRTLELSYLLKGSTSFVQLKSPYKIEDSSKIEKFRAKYTFKLDDHVDELGAENRVIKSGDYYTIDLPDKIQLSNPTDGSIFDKENNIIATYSFYKSADSTWHIKITFTSYVDDKNKYDIYGQLDFDFNLDLSSVPAGTSTQVTIPISNTASVIIDVVKPVPPVTTPTSLTKSVASYNNQTRELVWNIKVEPSNGIFSGCVFTDTINPEYMELKSIKHGSLTLLEGTDYTYDTLTGKLVYTIPLGRDGISFQNIVITTTVKPSVYGKLTATTISNLANLSGGDNYVNIDSNIASQTINPDWLSKSGSLYQGNKIKWSINANITNQSMYNGVITDNLQSDVKLDKTSVYLSATSITIYDNSYTPSRNSEVYGIYIQNPDGTATLKIYLPRGMENASSTKQTITYVTDVVAPVTVAAQNPTYNNRASLDCNYIGDGNTEGTLPTVNINQVGVSVPYVYIDKSHSTLSADDKRDGTITWTVAAASNVSSYGKTQIMDTLPDNQSFITDEIYWGSQKIDESTEPQASISADGRTLTIKFNNNNAISTIQNFTIKTKIDPEVYGDNISKNFTNNIKCNLLSETIGDVLATKSDSDSVNIQNTVIAKASTIYNENTTKSGQNPRIDFKITINSNLMPLSNVIINDNLDNIKTQFKKATDSVYSTLSGVKWTYVPDSLKVVKSAGTRDSLDLNSIISNSIYNNNTLSINFGDNVNDKYTITFTAELDILQNAVFKENGNITCSANIANIDATGLKSTTISSAPTGTSNVIKNEVLGKSGVNLVAEQQVQWTINLNQHRIMLDSPTVVDELPKGVTLDPTTIRLYKNVIGTDGNFISGTSAKTIGTAVPFNYTYKLSTEAGMEGRYVLSVDLPDKSTDYILTFLTDIDKSLLGTNINNVAYYSGQSKTSENFNTSTMTLSGMAGGGSTTKAAITVNKYDSDTGAGITGATFTLNWLRNGDANDVVFVRTLTATQASIIFRGLERGEKYTITEVSAPDNYKIDNPSPVEFTVPATGTSDCTPLVFYDTQIKTGSWIPQAAKELDGKDIIHTFQFEITDGTSSLLTGITDTKLSNGTYAISFGMNAGISPKEILNFSNNHTFSSSEPNGTKYLVTTKTFYIKELSSNLAGYSYDDTVYPLVVSVYNVKGQSSLNVVIKDLKGNVLSDEKGNLLTDKIPIFLNSYRANGSIQINGIKILNGHALATGQFIFELYEGNTLIDTQRNQLGTTADQQSYSGNFTFATINYTQSDVGIKTYKIVEKNTGLPGYNYDSNIYYVDVLVSDNDNGTLSSSIQSIKKIENGVPTDVSQITFTNNYTTTDATVTLNAGKNLSGRALFDNQFQFRFDQVAADQTLIKQIGTVTNTGNVISLPTLTFSQSDVGKSYYYQLSEIDDNKSGYTYDTSVYIIKLDILDNNDGTLKIVKTITQNGITQSQIEFQNSYKAIGSIIIDGTKSLTGKPLADGLFNFAMQQVDITDNKNIGNRIITKNLANGTIVFPVINYTEADAGKEFEYKVFEINDNIGGYQYDNSSYIVHVSVKDNGDGTLYIAKKVTNPEQATVIKFNNTYITTNVTTVFNARKKLIGRILTDQQFTFVLNQVSQNGTFIKEMQRTTNDINGVISFAPVSYTQSDMGKTYYYKVSEVNDENARYIYDNNIYDVIVNVVDNNDGSLNVLKTIKYNSVIVSELSFTNSYLVGVEGDEDGTTKLSINNDKTVNTVNTGDRKESSRFIILGIFSLITLFKTFIRRRAY